MMDRATERGRPRGDGGAARRGSGRGLAWGVCAVLAAGPALAGSYEFVPAPQIDLNRVYRVDRVTGEVTSCQYGLREGAVGSVGVTVCYGAGEGASAQVASEYGLVATRHSREAGVFRVNYRTGEMSICYVQTQKDAVVCTAQANPPAADEGPAAGGANQRSVPSVTPPQGRP
nr:hypothetical protein [Methylobacterium sp. Leaf399]